MDGFKILGTPNGNVGILVSTDGKVIINNEAKLVVHPTPKHQRRIKNLSNSELVKFLGVFFDYVEATLNPDNDAPFLVNVGDDRELGLMVVFAMEMFEDLKNERDDSGYSVKKCNETFWSDFNTVFA